MCLKKRTRELQVKMIKIMPELSQHALNYEDCLAECEKNKISYIVGEQSCRGVYEKQFRKSCDSVVRQLLGDGVKL